MKKALTILTVIIGLSWTSYGQVNPRTIGLRLGGDGSTNGAEISYQHGMGEANRLEFNLGFGGSKHYQNMFVSGVYQWNWHLNQGFNWYAGPGAALGFYTWDDATNNSTGVNLGIGGQIGVEYDFQKMDVPILLSLDARPMFDLIGYQSGLGWGAALGIRYIW